MQFWIIQAQENPAEPRSTPGRREWRSNTLTEHLAGRGHEAVRWRSSFSHQAKKQLVDGSVREPFEDYAHQFIHAPAYHRHIGLARIRNHRALAREFIRIADSYDHPPDLIHTGNVPIELCAATVAWGRARGIPVVIDVRDFWPDAYVEVLPARLDAIKAPLQAVLDRSNPRLKRAFRDAAAVTGLTGSSLDWAMKWAGRARRETDAVFHMCYPRQTPRPSDAELATVRAQFGLGDEDVLACYFGNIGFQSDFVTVVEAARRLGKTRPNFKVVLAGSGPMVEPLKERAKDLPNVLLPGWLNGSQMQALMHLSTFGLIAYRAIPSFLKSFSNKFSEYLAGGQVVACGLEGEMGGLVHRTGCGFVYREGDVEGLASAFDRTLADPEGLARTQAAARDLHAAQFDGAAVYPAFAEHLETIARQAGP